METIYKIIGGGQQVKQNVEFGIPTEYIKEESDYPEKAKCDGQDNYTNCMWHTDLETLKDWANAWAGKEVELVESNND